MSFTHTEIVDEMDKLHRFARRLCRNEHDAEDLLQSTILKALEKKHMFKEGTKLFSWVSKIMYNDFVSQYRRKVKFETQYDCEDFLMNQSSDPQQDNISELGEVNRAMEQLSEEHRTVLVCVCVKGMKYQEVSELLSVPVGTVRSRLSRAREQLQEIMEQVPVRNTPPLPPAMLLEDKTHRKAA